MHTTVHKRYYDVLRAQEAKQRVARRLAIGDSLAKATLTQGNRNYTRYNNSDMNSEEDGVCTYADLRVVTPRVLDPVQTLHLSFTALRTITELTHCNRAITALHPNFLQLESLEVLILRHNRLQTLHNLLPQSVPHLPPITTHSGKRKHNALSGPRGCVRLRQLLLAHNDLRDLASTDIPRLTSLEYLSLAHNRLTNVVHTAQQLRKLHSLRYLDCSESPICEEKNYREYMIAHLPQLDVLDRQVITQEERQAAAVRYDDTIKSADTINSSESNIGNTTTTKTKGSPWKEMSVCVRLLEKQHAAYLNAQAEAAAHAALVQERAVQEVTESKAAFHAVWALAAPKAAIVSQQQLNTAPVLSTSRRRSREGTTSTTPAGNTTTTKAKPSISINNGRTTAQQQQQQQMLLGTSMTAELRPQSEDGVVVRLPCQTVESLLQKKPLQLSPHSDSPVAIHGVVPHESVLYDALLGRTAAVAEKTCKTWRVTQTPAKQKKNKNIVNEGDVQSSEEGEVARVAVEEAEALQEMAGVVRHSAELLRSLRREQCVTKANTSTSNTTTNTIATAEANATSGGEGGEETTQMIELTAEQKAHYCALHAAQAAMIPAPWLCDDLTRRPTHIIDKEGSESTNTISQQQQQQQQQEVQLYLVQVLQQLFCAQELRAMESYFGLSEVLTAVQQQPQLQQQQQQQMLLALARSGSTQSSSGTSSTTHRSPTTTTGAAAVGNEAAATAGARKKANVRARNRGHNNTTSNSNAKGADGLTGAGSGGTNQAAVNNHASTGGNSASNINNSSGSITAAMSWAQDTQLLQLMTHAMTTPAPASESNNNTATSSSMQRGMTSGLSQPGVVGPYVPSSIDAFMNVLQKDSGAWSLDTKAFLRALCTAHNVPCSMEGAMGCDKAAGLTLRSTTLSAHVANESNTADEKQGVNTQGTVNGTAVRFILPSVEDTRNTDGVAGRTSDSVNEQNSRNTLPVSRGSLRSSSRKGSKKSVTDTVSADTEKVATVVVVNKTSNVKSPTAGLWLSVNNLLGALVCYVPFVQSRLAYFQAQSLRGVRQASQAATVKEWFDRAQAVQEHLRHLQAALQRASKETEDSSSGNVIVPHMLLLERKTHRVGEFFAKKHQATMYIETEGCHV